MKKAFYYPETGAARELSVLKENADGTVDLGTADADGKNPVLDIGKCPVASTSKTGHCTVEGGQSAIGGKAAPAKTDLDSKSKEELLELLDRHNKTAPTHKKIQLDVRASKPDLLSALKAAE